MLSRTKEATIGLCRRIMRTASPQTRVEFALGLLKETLSGHQARLEWYESFRIRRRIFRRFLRSWPYLPSGESLRIYGLFDLVNSLNDVPGDLVECGVGRGRTLTILCFANVFFGLGRGVYGFDSFEGFPDAGDADVGTRVPEVGQIPGWDDTSPDLILSALQNDREGSEEPSLFKDVAPQPVLVAGFFRDTLAANLPERIALLHLDADLYESTHDALSNCLDRMSAGGIIIFDELHEYDRWPGVQKAVRELCTPRRLEPVWEPKLQRFAIRIPRG